jgi:hypothetical protein
MQNLAAHTWGSCMATEPKRDAQTHGKASAGPILGYDRKSSILSTCCVSHLSTSVTASMLYKHRATCQVSDYPSNSTS